MAVTSIAPVDHDTFRRRKAGAHHEAAVAGCPALEAPALLPDGAPQTLEAVAAAGRRGERRGVLVDAAGDGHSERSIEADRHAHRRTAVLGRVGQPLLNKTQYCGPDRQRYCGCALRASDEQR